MSCFPFCLKGEKPYKQTIIVIQGIDFPLKSNPAILGKRLRDACLIDSSLSSEECLFLRTHFFLGNRGAVFINIEK